nr:MAG TPA: hypothetical protein [Caudoviricetes sp.]
MLFPISAFISICVLYHILLLFLFGISKASVGLSSKWHSIISYSNMGHRTKRLK